MLEKILFRLELMLAHGVRGPSDLELMKIGSGHMMYAQVFNVSLKIQEQVARDMLRKRSVTVEVYNGEKF